MEKNGLKLMGSNILPLSAKSYQILRFFLSLHIFLKNLPRQDQTRDVIPYFKIMIVNLLSMHTKITMVSFTWCQIKKIAMLVESWIVNKKKSFFKFNQHGGRDVTSKPPIAMMATFEWSIWNVHRNIHRNIPRE